MTTTRSKQDAADFSQSFLIEAPMLLHCGPIFFFPSSDPVPTNVAANGTFGLVDTGQKKIMVTCEHVWADFGKFREANPDAVIAVLLGENRPVMLSGIQPLDSDRSLDLATFDMEPFLNFCRSREFYQLPRKGIAAVRRKDALAILGYLGESRHTCAVGANFGYDFIGVSVSDTSGFTVCADITATRTIRDRDGATLPEARSLGGLSGSPCYRLMPNGSLRLVGFVTSSGLGIVRLTHAGCLSADGTLNRAFRL